MNWQQSIFCAGSQQIVYVKYFLKGNVFLFLLLLFSSLSIAFFVFFSYVLIDFTFILFCILIYTCFCSIYFNSYYISSFTAFSSILYFIRRNKRKLVIVYLTCSAVSVFIYLLFFRMWRKVFAVYKIICNLFVICCLFNYW